jgi:hypothetical protein
MTFMFVGDTHSDVSFVSSVCRFAKSQGVDTVFQLGDFGIWDHQPSGVYFLDHLNERAAQRGVKWIFVDGNHENHDSLRGYTEVTDSGMVVVRDNILWTGRTNVFDHDGYRFGAVGGAVSIDRHARIPGKSWWPQETTAIGDVYRFTEVVGDRPVDFLITHDAPSVIEPWEGFIKDDALSNANRDLMDEVGKVARPRWWFHGHYHKFLKYRFNDSRVYGLGPNPFSPFIREKNVAVFRPRSESSEPFIFQFIQ